MTVFKVLYSTSVCREAKKLDLYRPVDKTILYGTAALNINNCKVFALKLKLTA